MTLTFDLEPWMLYTFLGLGYYVLGLITARINRPYLGKGGCGPNDTTRLPTLLVVAFWPLAAIFILGVGVLLGLENLSSWLIGRED